MLDVKLENYVPIEFNGNKVEWNIRYLEGICFKAFTLSSNGNVKAEYILDKEGEKFSIVTAKGQILKQYDKKISQNDGTGTVRLSGGKVSQRYGAFRRKIFQDMLDKFNISNIIKLDDASLNRIIMLDKNKGNPIIYIPPYGKYFMFTKEKDVSCNGDNSRYITERGKIVLKSSEDQVVVTVDSPWWIVEDDFRDERRRKLYIRKTSGIANVLSLEPELTIMFADNKK